jgi:hypothetical protein
VAHVQKNAGSVIAAAVPRNTISSSCFATIWHHTI